MSFGSITSRLRTDRIDKLESNFEGYIAAVVLLAYAALILYNIVSRVITNTQINGSLEITMGMFTWVVWLAASFAVRRQAHLRFTLFRRNFSQNVNYVLHVIEWVLWVVIAGVILRFSLTVLGDRIAQGAEVSTTGIPDYLLYLSVPVGLSLLILRVLQQAVLITRMYRAGEDITPDPSLL